MDAKKLSTGQEIPRPLLNVKVHYRVQNSPKVNAILSHFFLMGWDLRHQVLRPLLAYCTAPDDR
jgi:hypothetical protein